MKELNLPNITLMALVACCFIQFGAQLFALTVIASTVAEAPPRSFAMFEGEYGYNSSAFWDTVPPITFVLFVLALFTNWKTGRRKLILLALTLFIIGGLIAGFYLEPLFAEMIEKGFRDEVDPGFAKPGSEVVHHRLDGMCAGSGCGVHAIDGAGTACYDFTSCNQHSSG